MRSIPFRNSGSHPWLCKPSGIRLLRDELHFSLLSAARKSIRTELQSTLPRPLSEHSGSYPPHVHYDRNIPSEYKYSYKYEQFVEMTSHIPYI